MSGFGFREAGPVELLEVEILAERVRLVPTSREHAQQIFREFTSEITEYMYPQAPKRIEETLEFVDSGHKKMEVRTDLQLTILADGTGEFLGCCGLHELSKLTARVPGRRRQ